MSAPALIAWHDPDKGKSRALCEAFAQGGGGAVRSVKGPFIAAPAAFYGVTPAAKAIFEQVVSQGLPFYYIDNPYFGRGDYYRVTKNAKQHKGLERGDEQRFQQFNITIKPWRKTGDYVLVTTQSEWWYVLHGTTMDAWITQVLAEIRAVSNRPIVLRRKPKAKLMSAPNHYTAREVRESPEETPLDQDLANAWAVVTHSSNTAVEAILEGIPAFCTSEDCAAVTMGTRDLSKIETPLYPEGRYEWACALAANQWTVEEMRSGLCWRMLREEIECPA